jgi:hypothetical protein
VRVSVTSRIIQHLLTLLDLLSLTPNVVVLVDDLWGDVTSVADNLDGRAGMEEV